MKKYLIALLFASLFNISFATNHVADNDTSSSEFATADTDKKVGDYIAVSTRDEDFMSITVYRTSKEEYYAMVNGTKYTVYKNPSYKERAKNNPRTSSTHYIQHDMWKYYFSI